VPEEFIEVLVYCVVGGDLSYAYEYMYDDDAIMEPSVYVLDDINGLYDLLSYYISPELKERIDNSVIEHISVSKYQTFDMLTITLCTLTEHANAFLGYYD
jgi:hypothetical protein